MAKEELQVLVDEGALKITGTKKPEWCTASTAESLGGLCFY